MRTLAASIALTLAALAPLGCTRTTDASSASADAATQAKIKAALAGPQRDDEERARDVYRHPIETLSFFGLKDDMTVVELSPGFGWYTAVLAPVLAENGRLVAAQPDVNGDEKSFATKEARAYVSRLAEHPEFYRHVGVVVMDEKHLSLGPDASADMVVTFRNVHNWIDDGIDHAVFASAFRVLKHGGVFGVEEHRAKPGQTLAELKDKGYVPTEYVLALAKEAGFVLDASSEINANPKDTKDYPEGVWTLPPSLALKDKDRDKYLAIGESDRMTLRFVKP